MKMSRLLRGFAVALACVGLFTQQCVLAAGPVNGMTDVALNGQGHLYGQVVDTQGTAVAGSVVLVKHNGRTLANARTDDNGRFAFSGMRGGIYELQSAESNGLYRVWTEGTAPPVAQRHVMLVDGQTVRAQGCDACDGGGCDDCCDDCCRGGLLASPWVIAGIAATAIALPLALDDNGS